MSRFQSSQDQLKKVFFLPHEVAFEPYLKAFQYKVLNSILFTNIKLCKIGYIQADKCSLCKTDSESLYHIFFESRNTKQFWKEFQYYFYTLTREFVCLTLQDVITGIMHSNPAISNSVNSKSPLFRRKIEFPWIYPYVFSHFLSAISNSPLFRTHRSFPTP